MAPGRERYLKDIIQNPTSYNYAKLPDELRNDRDFLLQALEKSKSAQVLQISSEKAREELDRNFILQYAAVKFDFSLKLISEKWRHDKQVVLAALTKKRIDENSSSAPAFKNHQHHHSQQNHEKEDNQNNAAASELFLVGDELKKDREVVMAAIQSAPGAIQDISDEFRNDREIVMLALKSDRIAFKSASEELRRDKEVVFMAIQHEPFSFMFASEELKTDRQVVLEAVALNYRVFKYLPKGNPCKADKLIIFHGNLKTVMNAFKEETLDESGLIPFLFQDKKPEIISKGIFSSFTYSVKFVQTFAMLMILKKLNESSLKIETETIADLDYHLFCIKLEQHIESKSPKHPVGKKHFKEALKTIVDDFPYHHYSKKEHPGIVFLIKRILKHENPNWDWKMLISEYMKTTGDSKKVISSFQIFTTQKKVKNYELISSLGFGGEGVVFKAFDKRREVFVAVKIKFQPEYDMKKMDAKIEFLKRQIDGKINCFECGILEYGQDKIKTKHLFSIMELGEETLRNIIERNHSSGVGTSLEKDKMIEVLEMFAKILQAVQSVHNQNIAHRDLDPNNILKIGDKFKIIDFDQSRVIEVGKSITINVGKYTYMAPEVSDSTYEKSNEQHLVHEYQEKLIQNKREISTASDIFSLGCIFLELLTDCLLKVSKQFIGGTDISQFDSNFTYFSSEEGLYFHSAVVTAEGEMRVHHAIRMTIDKQINKSWGVNEILTRCLITMIQRDPRKRLDCFTYKIIIDNLTKYLRGEINDYSENIHKELDDLLNIQQLINYYDIIQQNTTLKQENLLLSNEISTLRNENELLKQEIEKLKQANQVV
ncbi:protein kinase [Naegleria gruberi]|uniref:non-specific serine/threonine protein kinase n=1 Tax=Naegleria gruberi TaxID=5762 RepID=D2VPY5_NAEGR|nr:protein kinase [Naegleria gruberi]EFC41087.1 protein kinase [Naegleria gruberi]|eukprot:XP_002673831.1 protein kinase [Naegleria gruberi]